VDEASAELVSRWQSGDEAAANELFRRYADRLLALAQNRLSSRLATRVDAEDVVQSVYRSFFANARAGRYLLEHSGDLWRLLVVITLNKVRGQAVHHQADKRALDRERPLESGTADWHGLPVTALTRQPTPLDAAALADELEHFMRDLEPKHRQVFELRLQGYTMEEIADACGRSVRTVKRVLSLIRESLERAQVLNNH
jgi:RNA polymerase sigma factor (sigma-70 family)